MEQAINIFSSKSVSSFISQCIKKWKLFVIIGLVAGIAGILYAFTQPVIYQSRLSFAMDEGGSSGSSGGGLLGLASQFGLNIGGSSDVFSGDNIMTIIKSRKMIEKALLSVDTFDNKPQTLIDYYLEKTSAGKNKKQVKITFPPFQDRLTFTVAQDSLLYKTYLEFEADGLDIWKPDKYLTIYEVKVVSPNEKFTKVFTERIVAETNNYYTDFRSRKSRETLNILEQRVEEMRGNLNSSIINKATAQDANINPGFAVTQVPVAQGQVKIQTYGEAYAEMFKNLELARFQYLKQIPLMQVIDPAQYPMHKIKWSKLKTGILFSIGACFLTLLILWATRIVKLYFL